MLFASVVQALSPSAFYRCQDTLPAASFASVLSAANRFAIYNAAYPNALADASGNSNPGQVEGVVSFGQPGPAGAGTEICNLLDRMVSDGRATIS